MAMMQKVVFLLVGLRAALDVTGQAVCSDGKAHVTVPGDSGVLLVQMRQQRSTRAALVEEEEEEELEDEFTWLQGACRTAASTPGRFTRLRATEPECRQQCAHDLLCVAWEFRQPDHCESHFDAIDHAEPRLPGYSCWVRAAGAQPPADAPTPSGLFTAKAGACRTSSGSQGTYTTVDAGAARCREQCAADASCMAYEHRRPHYCELHREAISHADPSIQNSACYVRTASSPAPPAPAGPMPVPAFRELQGACRTASGSAGSYHAVIANSSECRGHCASEPSCVAFEHGPADRCELHQEAVDHAEVAARGYACWVREQAALRGTPAPTATPNPAPAPTSAPTAVPTAMPTPAQTGTPTPAPRPALGSDSCSAFRSEPEGVALLGRMISSSYDQGGKSQTQCCQDCTATPGCEGFTFFSAGQGGCYLYANVTGRLDYGYTGIISLVKPSVVTTTTTTTTATTTTATTTKLDADRACFYTWQETGICSAPACEFNGARCIVADSRPCPEIYRETRLCHSPRCMWTYNASCIDSPSRNSHHR